MHRSVGNVLRNIDIPSNHSYDTNKLGYQECTRQDHVILYIV